MSSLLDWLIQNEPSFSKSRLPSLYSDLTVQKTTNPDGYAANVTTWQSALTRAAIAGQLPAETRLTLHTSDELLNALASSQYGRPSGLGAVIDDSVRQGKMIDLREFLTTEKSIYSRSWVPSPWSILQWSLRQIGLTGGKSYDVSGRLRVGNLVLIQALEEVSKQVLAMRMKKGQSLTDRIVSREAFVEDLTFLGADILSNQDLDVLLRYLQRDKQAISFDSKTIKFKATISSLPEPISPQDTTIANLKLLIANLESLVSALQTRITSLQSKAQVAVKSGNKHSAMSALRSKRLAEKNLEQRTAMLQQLEEVFTNIEQAADQVEVVKAMEASAGVLKGLNKEVGGVERVEDVVDRLREEMSKVEEVAQVINEPLDQKAPLDEEEVDEELAAMVTEQRRAEDEVEAEKTRERLLELQKNAAKGQELQEVPSENVEEELKTSTQRLRGMSIEDEQGKSANATGHQDMAAEEA